MASMMVVNLNKNIQEAPACGILKQNSQLLSQNARPDRWGNRAKYGDLV